MSCKTRTELETSIDTAFNDLIGNTALLCEQINTEEKHDLWMMAGTVYLTYDSGTGENALSWSGPSSNTTINPGTLSFINSDTQIQIAYPSDYYDPGNNILTLGCAGVANKDVDFRDYNMVTRTTNMAMSISMYETLRTTAWINYNGTSWQVSIGPGWLQTGLSFSYNSSTGAIRVTSSYKMSGVPTVSPTPTTPATPVMYVPFCSYVDDYNIDVYLWDLAAGNVFTGSLISGLRFNIDYGTYTSAINLKTTDFGTSTRIPILFVGQKVVTA